MVERRVAVQLTTLRHGDYANCVNTMAYGVPIRTGERETYI